jgi:hypothetical protein
MSSRHERTAFVGNHQTQKMRTAKVKAEPQLAVPQGTARKSAGKWHSSAYVCRRGGA